MIIILSLLFLLPLCKSDIYLGENKANQEMLKTVGMAYEKQSWGSYKLSVDLLMEKSKSMNIYPIIYFEVPDPYTE